MSFFQKKHVTMANNIDFYQKKHKKNITLIRDFEKWMEFKKTAYTFGKNK